MPVLVSTNDIRALTFFQDVTVSTYLPISISYFKMLVIALSSMCSTKVIKSEMRSEDLVYSIDIRCIPLLIYFKRYFM